MFSEVEPDDLLRYGLIPELVGRLPVTVALEGLDEEALVRILKEPKNALTKQYAKLFGLEDVKITFDEAALVAIASKALKRGTGARGLRAILEEVLMEVMFDLPGREDVVEVKVTESCITNGTQPLLEISPIEAARRKRRPTNQLLPPSLFSGITRASRRRTGFRSCRFGMSSFSPM